MAMEQEPMKIGGTYHRLLAYVSGLCFWEYPEYPQKIWPEIMVLKYQTILDPEDLP